MGIYSLMQFSWSLVYMERDVLHFSKLKELETQITEFLSFVTKKVNSSQTSELNGRT